MSIILPFLIQSWVYTLTKHNIGEVNNTDYLLIQHPLVDGIY